jgi:glycosyltransferase involved in cell wall biosynthesis
MSPHSEEKYSITVVIPAYNAADYIARAIDSVLAQTRSADEIIVVDDGSTDNTGEIVAGYGSKVKYIRQENAGASAARNTGINAATGTWIAFLDADDEWLTDRLKLQIELLQRNPDLVWTTGNYIRCLCTQNQRTPHIDPLKNMTGGKEYFDSYFQAFLMDSWGCTDTMLIKREVLIDAGLFRTGQLRGNDFDMWWRVAYRRPKIGFVPQPLAIYHLDVQGSIIRKHTDAQILSDLIDRHLKLSADHDKLDDFRPCAVLLLRRWMRGMLFEARPGDVREMISRFDELLGGGYKTFMRLLTTFPRTTATACGMISRILKLLRLRRPLARSRR